MSTEHHDAPPGVADGEGTDRWKQRVDELRHQALRHREEIGRLQAQVTMLSETNVEQLALLEQLRQERPRYKRKIATLRAEVAALEQAHHHARYRARQYRLQLEERTTLRHLLHARAVVRRETPPTPPACERAAAHASFSVAYRDLLAGGCPVPETASSASTLGMEWWVPPDNRRERRLADRILRGWLPLADLLHAQIAIGGGVMLDIGANVGTTCLPRVMLGHVEQVYAAEPEPANFACLVRNTVRNALEGFVFPDRVAIGDRDGTAHLKISEAIGGHAVVDQLEPGTLDVPLRRLDSWLRAQSVDVKTVRFVKIDTQGYEAHVLAGAPHLLAARSAAWQIEFAPSHLRKAGTDPQDLIARLQGGFTHFLELKPASPGPRVHPVSELANALSRITQGFPEILLYHATQAAADTRFTSP